MSFFGDPSKKYRRKARSLVSNCQTLAMSTFDDFAASSPIVGALAQRGDTERWDVVMTMAGVGVALGQVERALPEKQFLAFHKALLDNLRPWYANAVDMLQHQDRFILHRADHGIDHDTAIGEWVVSNLKGGAPSNGDMDLAPIVTRQLQLALESWWTRIN